MERQYDARHPFSEEELIEAIKSYNCVSYRQLALHINCQNYTEQYKGAAAHTVTTRLQVRKGERQMEDGDCERRRETSSSFVFLHSNPCIIIGYK